MRISDWSSDVCSSDLGSRHFSPFGRSPDAMLAFDPAPRARRGAHHDAFGGEGAAAAVIDAAQQRSVGNPGRGKDAVALRQVAQVLSAVEVLDSPLAREPPPDVVSEQQRTLDMHRSESTR